MKRILALALAAAFAASPALATEKSTAALQADLLTYKLRTFNAEADYQNKLNITDSMFNKTTDTLDDIPDGSTNSLVPAADAALLAAITASAAEINSVADATGKVVTSTDAGTLALTAALHANRIVNFNDADGDITLPAATGTGDVYRVYYGTTSTTGTITVAPATDDLFLGVIFAVDTDDDSGLFYPALVGDAFDTMTLGGVTTGGLAGDLFTFVDSAAGVWSVSASLRQSGGSEATPFSDGSITAP